MRATEALQSGLRLGGGFLAWWGGELAALRPAWIIRLLQSQQRWLLLRPDGDGFGISMEQRGQERLLSDVSPVALREFAQDADAAMLVLPVDMVLRRKVDLPAVDDASLARLIPNELDRFTPFSAADAWFDWHVVARRPGDGRITVEIFVIDAAQATPLLQRATAAGVTPDRVILEKGQAPADIDLLRWQPRRIVRRLWPRLVAVTLLLLAVGQSGALVTAWNMREEETLLELRQSVQTLRPAAEAGDRQRRELSMLRERAEFLNSAQGQRSVLQDVAALTRALPDDAWLHSLQIGAGRIQVGGQARDASALIQRIEAEDGLRNAQFRQPVTKAGGSGLDRFEIGIERMVGQPK
ncbi:PilN domain-containing protein [Ferrovibrio sp.]|uniref:PilN domain-containing protein n=1 Tax=Ferrovibrio sp. TaxID=1917215 RepID=UPI003D0A57F9